jgi:hypothetical protein
VAAAVGGGLVSPPMRDAATQLLVSVLRLAASLVDLARGWL